MAPNHWRNEPEPVATWWRLASRPLLAWRFLNLSICGRVPLRNNKGVNRHRSLRAAEDRVDIDGLERPVQLEGEPREADDCRFECVEVRRRRSACPVE